jgi:hypothetical protein
MTVLLRSFIVWLMLLALPYQGYASAAMMLCAPVVSTQLTSSAPEHMAMPEGPHDHAAMMATMATGDGGNSAHSGHSGHSHGGVKCGGSACCVAGAPLMTLAIAVPVLPAVSSAVSFYSEVLHAVDLAHPERPPQGNFV